MGSIAAKSVLSVVCALPLVAVLLALLLGEAGEGFEGTDPSVGIDVISDSANTGASVGTVNFCRAVTVGETFVVDMVIEDVTGLTGFQANLLYDPSILRLVPVSQTRDVDYRMCLVSSGTNVIELGESLPDDGDGSFGLAAVQFPLSPASGSGVLARMRVESIGEGTDLSLSGLKLADGTAQPIEPSDSSGFYVGPVNSAVVAVDTKCPGVPTLGPSEVRWSDIDCDGAVAIGDALKTARYLIGLSVS